MSALLKPFGPTPSERQLKWHALEAYAFVHFSINTFTDKEWGYGDEPPSRFNPAEFDADQIVGTVASVGLKGLVLTCKHHDGFCLWPSPHTEHSVKHSPWQDGQGDMVREFAEACARHNIKFGVYLSPWDRNHAEYGTPKYLEYFRAQLRELLTSYGPLFEIWFDGANGGDGYYGGARETRTIDNETYYDWPNTWEIVRELQPDAVMFSDAGPDIRWVGNERGVAGDPCWSAVHPENTWPGHADTAQLNRGDRDGTVWRPAEVDVSVRPGWFFHPDEQIKPVSRLVKIYFESVGRGAGLILNLAPDRRGLIPEHDVTVLQEWHRILSKTFANNLAHGAQAAGGDSLLDENRATFWSGDNASLTPEIEIQLARETTFNVVRLREYLLLGQRVDEFAVDYWTGNAWQEFANGTSIGNCRLVQSTDITTTKIRLRITAASAVPALSELALFHMETIVDAGPESEGGSGSQITYHIVSANSGAETVMNLLNNDPEATWDALRENAEVILDLGTSQAVHGFTFLPRQDGKPDGTPSHYAIYVADDTQNWGEPVVTGEFSNIRANPIAQKVTFPQTAGRYVRFEVLKTLDGSPAVVAGLEITSSAE